MVNAICGWSHRGVEVSWVNDVGFWKPVAGVRQLWASLYHPFTESKWSANVRTTGSIIWRNIHYRYEDERNKAIIERTNSNFTNDAFLQSLSAPL